MIFLPSQIATYTYEGRERERETEIQKEADRWMHIEYRRPFKTGHTYMDASLAGFTLELLQRVSGKREDAQRNVAPTLTRRNKAIRPL